MAKISDQINYGENNIVIKEDIAIMDLYDTCGNKIDEVIFDAEDVEKLKGISWYRVDSQRSTYYCHSNKSGRMHRFILGITDKAIIVDHINHNGLDNRKCNLRTCTNQQNICNQLLPKNNKSGHKGVYWSNERCKWVAQITVNNKTKALGRFNTIEEAVKVRNEVAKKYYGEFANEI